MSISNLSLSASICVVLGVLLIMAFVDVPSPFSAEATMVWNFLSQDDRGLYIAFALLLLAPLLSYLDRRFTIRVDKKPQ